MKKYRLSQSNLQKIIQESIYRCITEEDNKDNFTIDFFDATNNESIGDTSYNSNNFESADEAIDSAREGLEGYIDSKNVIIATVYLDGHNIYSISNKSKQETSDSGFSSHEINEYLGYDEANDSDEFHGDDKSSSIVGINESIIDYVINKTLNLY